TPADAARRVEWRGGEARLFRDRFYLLPPRARPAREAAYGGFAPFVRGAFDGRQAASTSEHAARREAQRVAAGLPWHGPEGRIVLEPVDERDRSACGFPESWARDGLQVRFRAGGERFKPAGDAHHRTLKAWLQRRGVVPWMRE